MPRHRKNINEKGHAHGLTFSCYRRFPFLKAERTCLWFLESLETARQEFEFDVWAYVVMPDHVHLIIYPRREEYDIAEIRKAIKAAPAKQAIAWLEANAPE